MIVATGKVLLQHHRDELHRSGLNDDTIAAAQIHSETNYDTLAATLGWKKFPRGMAPAIVFPVPSEDGSPGGYAMVKPDRPREVGGKVHKYEQPKGRPARPYVPPRTRAVLSDPSVELLLTEGQKKALCSDQNGFPTVGLPGVWNWKPGAEETLLPELERIAWKGRKVRIVFDSDAADKKPVRDAESRFAAHLKARGADVRVVRLPPGPPDANGEPTKQGLDDYIVAEGIGPLRKLLDAATEADEVDPVAMKADARQMDPATEAAKFMQSVEKFAVSRLIFHRGAFHWWRRGRYAELQTSEVRARLVQFSNRDYSRLTTNCTANLLDQVRAAAMLPGYVEPGSWLREPPKLNGKPFPSRDVLVAKNGLIHLRSFVAGLEFMVKPTPAYFSTISLDYDFVPDAPQPEAWLNFLADLWPDDAQSIETLCQWMGYCLVADTSLQKILGMFGPRRSGKGTICRIQRALLGEANTAGPTLASFSTNFGLWPLLGKSLAIISDARLSGRTDQAIVVERLLSISGEDAQTIDRKHQEPVTCRLPTRIQIVSNELPRLNDASGALIGRLIVLRLTKSFYGAEDPRLTDKLLIELPGILLWAIGGWKRLNDAGRFTQPDSALELLGDMSDLSSPIAAFVRDCCFVGPAHRAMPSELYAGWKKWGEDNGRKEPGTLSVFARDLIAAVPGIRRVRTREGEERQTVYDGIRLRETST